MTETLSDTSSVHHIAAVEQLKHDRSTLTAE